jgi:hypothetical protein
MKDRTDTAEESLAAFEGAEEEQADDAEESSEAAEDRQEPAAAERLYAGKYKTPEELEAAYGEIQKFTGGRKILEDKAAAYDQLVRSQARSEGQSQKGRPKLTSYITEEGAIDTQKYDADMDAWEAHNVTQSGAVATRVAQEQVDLRKAETEFPYLVNDKMAAKAVIAGYNAGEYGTLYESAKAFDDYRQSLTETGKKVGADTEKRDLSKKIRGTTERSTGRSVETGEMTEERFAKLSRAEQRQYLDTYGK